MAKFIRGITYKPTDVLEEEEPEAIPCMRTKNIQEDLEQDDLVYIPRRLARAEKHLKKGDILVSSANSWNLVGKCCWIPELPYNATFGGFTSVLRPDESSVCPRYLYRWFSSQRVQNTVRSFGQQTTNISNLNQRRCLELPISLPPLDQQRRIAAILDKADALRRKRKRVLDLLDSLTCSIFLEMFGDPVSNAMSWSAKPICDVCDVVTGNTPSRQNKAFYGSDIEWIKSDNLDSANLFVSEAAERLSHLGKSVGRVAPAGATLVTCIAGSPSSIGNAAMTNREVAFNQQINALIPKSLEPIFLYFQIKLVKRLVQEASTGGMKGLVSKSRLERVKLICPPDCDQLEFSKRARLAEAVQIAGHNRLSTSEALFASLQSRAFSGQL